MNWNLLLLKLLTKKIWNNINDILTSISITQTNYFRKSGKSKNLFSYLETLILASWVIMSIWDQWIFRLFCSHSCLPLIIQPTRITSHSNALIGNIDSNVIDAGIISENRTTTISDHWS